LASPYEDYARGSTTASQAKKGPFEEYQDAVSRGVVGTVKAAKGAVKAAAGTADLIGKGLSFLGAVQSTPVAYGIKALAGNETPVTFSPTTSYDQLREAYANRVEPNLSPEIRSVLGTPEEAALLGDIGLGLATGKVANVIGGRVLMPAAKALGEPLRGVPGISSIMEFKRPGSSLPAAIRKPFFDILKTHEGEADWQSFVREVELKGLAKGVEPDQLHKVREAIETQQLGALSQPERKLADYLVGEYSRQIQSRLAPGGKPYELQSERGLQYAGPRIPTPAGRKHFDIGQRYEGEPVLGAQPKPALSTGGMKKRTELGRELTTGELQDVMGQGPVFQDIVTATKQGGAVSDTRTMHMGIVKDLMDRFGHPVNLDEVPMSKLRGIPTGFDEATRAKLETTALPKNLHLVVNRLNQAVQPRELNKTMQAVGVANRFFKRFAVFSPGFAIRNWTNNVAQTAIFGNNNPVTVARTWGDAGRVLSKMATAKSIAELGADRPMIEKAIRFGVIGRGQIAQEAPTAARGARKLGGFPFGWLRDANSFGEDMARYSFWRYNMMKGMSPAGAADRVDQVLFNYSPRFQSRGFKTTRQTLVPFINWSANIPGLAARSFIEKPGSLGFIGRTRADINQRYGFTPEQQAALPDFLKQQLPVATPAGKFTMGGYGTTDVNQMADAAMGGAPAIAREIGGRMYPAFSVAAGAAFQKELLTNKSFFTDYRNQKTGEVKRYVNYETAPSILKLLDGHMGVKVWPDGGVTAPVETVMYIRSIPGQRVASVLTDLLTGGRGAARRGLSFLGGLQKIEEQPSQPRR
jgi:hypothetical protein